jgi:hypothetical protein
VDGRHRRAAETIDGRPGNGIRESREERRDPRDVRALLAFGVRASHQDVLDECGLDPQTSHQTS